MCGVRINGSNAANGGQTDRHIGYTIPQVGSMPGNLEMFRYLDHPVVSPIYLELIKLYELVAWGDRLFLDAIDHFKLPRTGSVDRLKRSVRKATIPRSTKVLEISTTLHEPTPARELTLYIAEQTVKPARDVAAETLERPAAPHTVAPLARQNRQ